MSISSNVINNLKRIFAGQNELREIFKKISPTYTVNQTAENALDLFIGSQYMLSQIKNDFENNAHIILNIDAFDPKTVLTKDLFLKLLQTVGGMPKW